MRFALSDEQRQFSESLRDLLADAGTAAIVRAWAAGEQQPGLKLWRQLAEMGVTALLIPQRWDGMEAGPVDLVVAFEELGYYGVPGPLVETVAVAPFLVASSGEYADGVLPKLAAGQGLATVSAPPNVPFLLDADVADTCLFVSNGAVFHAEAGTQRASVDAARRLFECERGAKIADTTISVVDEALNMGTLAVSAQLLGAGRMLLDKATEHAQQRSQYGRVIGGFQAIKHLLADVATQIELARPLLYGAAVALGDESADATRDVSAAKIAAADAAYLAARTSLQVHGAVGYTAEHDVSLWLTKVRALVSSWGTNGYHRARVAAALRAASNEA